MLRKLDKIFFPHAGVEYIGLTQQAAAEGVRS